MSIYIRLALVYLLIISVSVTWVLKIFYDEIKPGIRQASEETLVDNANFLAEILVPYLEQEDFPLKDITSLFRRFQQRSLDIKIWSYVKQSTNLDLYITDSKGVVLFHSSDATQQGKDYSRWLDVSRTLSGKYGARTTRIDPDDDLTGSMYVAAPILKGEEIIGVVTLIQAHQGIHQFVGPAQHKILTIGGILLLTLMVLGVFLTTSFNNVLTVLTQYVNKIRDGKSVEKLSFKDPSFNQLALTLHRMREELDGKAYIEQYVHTLTHELKTPLSAISASAQILLTDVEGDRKHQFIGNIESEVQRLKQLVERLLLLASIENNQARDFKSVNLSLLLEDEVESLAPLLSNKNMTINIAKKALNSNEMFDSLLSGDEFLLRMAIRNVLDNAIEFSSENTCIAVELIAMKNTLIVRIINQGAEIPEYALSRIFERFFSMPRPDTGRKSSGLGLCLVEEIVSLHGGTIRLMNRHQPDVKGVEAELILSKKD